MTETWEIQCYDGATPKWPEPKTVCLPKQEVVGLLRNLLCRSLSPDEIIDVVAGSRRDLLEVAPLGNDGLQTPNSGIYHYTACRLPRP